MILAKEGEKSLEVVIVPLPTEVINSKYFKKLNKWKLEHRKEENINTHW